MGDSNIDKLKERRAYKKLIRLVKSRDMNARKQAVKALEEMDYTPQNQKERAWFLIAREDIEGLSSMGSDVVPILKKNLDHFMDEDILCCAIKALSNIGGKKAAKALLAGVFVVSMETETFGVLMDAFVKVGEVAARSLRRWRPRNMVCPETTRQSSSIGVPMLPRYNVDEDLWTWQKNRAAILLVTDYTAGKKYLLGGLLRPEGYIPQREVMQICRKIGPEITERLSNDLGKETSAYHLGATVQDRVDSAIRAMGHITHDKDNV